MAQTVRQLLAKRADIARQMREMEDAADENTGSLPADVQAKFDALKAALVDLEQAINNRSVVEDLERRIGGGAPLGSTGDPRLDQDVARRYSIRRAIAGAAGLEGVDSSYEKEIGQELARRSGRNPRGFYMPLGALSPPLERRVTSTTLPAGGPGGDVIGTFTDPALFVPPLYAALRVRQAGARVITGLVQNLNIPAQPGAVVGSWVAENAPLTFTDPTFATIPLSPKHYGTISEFSRNLLLQSTPDIEIILRNDMSNVLARGLDAAAIAGLGPASNQPLGILSQPGIGSVALGTNGGLPTWASILALVEQVELANVGDDARAFLGNPKVKALLMATPRVPATALGFILDGDGGMMAGARFLQTTLVPSNGVKGTGSGLSTLLYGNFSDLLIGLWSEIDILVNPFESVAYTKGNVQVRAMMTCDIGIRHPGSFAAIEDMIAA